MHAETGIAVTIRFALPCEPLRPYVTTYYQTQVSTPDAEPVIEDHLHPEWPNLRFMKAGWSQAAIGNTPMGEAPAFAVTGTTTRATRFRVSSGKSWGIGLMPLGWVKLFGVDASDYADRYADGNVDPAFAAMRPLARRLANRANFASDVAAMDAHLIGMLNDDVPHSDTIIAINTALVDPDIASAAALAERVDMNLRSLERLSRRAFGFPPKLLLRRQRFLRSLAQFMLDPSLKWLSTLDYQYHDQAHFVRDFKRFMGMTPGAYARLEKPMLVAAAQARMAIAGEAVQGLHDPGLYQPDPRQ
ncbi:MAG: helix-turn-helix domain-containing protein [Erythrobacter sp.]